MDIGTKVKVNLSATDAGKLGINAPKGLVDMPGTIIGHYENDVEGRYIQTNDHKSMAIADRYNALTAV